MKKALSGMQIKDGGSFTISTGVNFGTVEKPNFKLVTFVCDAEKGDLTTYVDKERKVNHNVLMDTNTAYSSECTLLLEEKLPKNPK